MHDEAATADDTDWPQILALYEVLDRIAPNPMVTLNRAVAVAMAGDRDAARAGYRAAARRTTSIPEQRYLDGRASRLT